MLKLFVIDVTMELCNIVLHNISEYLMLNYIQGHVMEFYMELALARGISKLTFDSRVPALY